MTCPNCNGEKNIMGLFPVYADDVLEEKRKPVIVLPCDFCGATGIVDNDYPERKIKGEKARQIRLKEELTLREFCKKFVFDVMLVSYYERGKKIRSLEEREIEAVYNKLAEE